MIKLGMFLWTNWYFKIVSLVEYDFTKNKIENKPNQSHISGYFEKWKLNAKM